MKQNQLNKKIADADKKLAKLTKKYGTHNGRQVRHPFALRFKVRSQVFTYSKNLVFNPLTEIAHSYDWYEISKRINGRLVLNNYRYSSTTGKHVAKLRMLFSQLGLKYIELSAPRGLQNLENAKEKMLELYAAATVANKYARIKTKEPKHLKTLESLGIKYTAKEVRFVLEVYEAKRTTRLAEMRAKNEAKRLADRLSKYPTLSLVA